MANLSSLTFPVLQRLFGLPYSDDLLSDDTYRWNWATVIMSSFWQKIEQDAH